MAKICMISIDHSPLDDRIYYKEALTLQKAGHEVTMICRADKYGVMYDMGGTVPLNIPNQTEVEFENIIAYPIKSPKSSINKALNKVFKGKFFTDFIEKAVEIEADVYHAHEPVSYYIGLQIAKRIKTKLVFDSHESFTTGTPKEIWIKNRYLSNLEFLISANHLTRGHLVSLNPKIKSEVIYNAAETNLFTDKTRLNKPKNIIIAHDGYLPFNRGLKTMLEAIKIVLQKHSGIKFKIIGETSGEEKEYLHAFISDNQMTDTIYETGWKPYEEVAQELSDCSIGVIAKTPTVNNIIGGPPIKYYNYTAAGMAIIDVDMPETTRLLSKFKNGISTKDRTSDGLAKALDYLISNPKILHGYMQNSVSAFASLNWDIEGKKMTEFYSNVILNDSDLIKH